MAHLSRPGKFDNKYKISDRNHIRRLSESSLEQLGVLLSGSVGVGASGWKALACQLGLSNADVQAIEAAANPGYEVLRRWRVKQRSTVRVLRENLAALGRDDVIAQLEKMLFDLVHLTIDLYHDGRHLYNFSGNCPGKMPLIDFVRPQIDRKMSTVQLLQPREKPIFILLHRDPSEEPEMTWTTRAKHFRGQHVVLEKCVSPPRERSDRQRPLKNAIRPERFVVSELADTCVYFDVVDDVIADDTSSSHSSRSSSIESPVDEDGQQSQRSSLGGVHGSASTGSPPIQEEQGQREMLAVKEDGEPPGCSAADGSLELHENLLLPPPSASRAAVQVERMMADCRLSCD